MPITSRQRLEFNSPHGQAHRVTLTLDGDEVLLTEKYQIKIGILTVPAAFAITLGTKSGLAKLIEKYAPNTKFELRIDGTLLMTGRTDGQESAGPGNTLVLRGRDALAPLHDSALLQEDSYKDDTYAALCRKVMDSVGLKSTPLVFTNRANRAAMVGKDPENYRVKGAAPTAARRDVSTLSITDEGAAGGAVKKHIQSQLGEKAYEFLKRHLDRAGLFLWAAADGSIVLSEPNATQPPIYRLQRSQGASPEFSTIADHSFSNNTTGRFSEVHVYTRGETKRAGRTTTVAKVTDSEMIEWGFQRPMVLRDVNADSQKKAEFMGRRKMAESRRQGFKLSYTLAGHAAGTLLGGRALLVPDTMCEVSDEQLGFDENFWIEAVTLNCTPKLTTVLDLMRPGDLIFGEEPT